MQSGPRNGSAQAQAPVFSSQYAPGASHTTGSPATHPKLGSQLSTPLQATPSSHSGTSVRTQKLVSGSQRSTPLQALPSSKHNPASQGIGATLPVVDEVVAADEVVEAVVFVFVFVFVVDCDVVLGLPVAPPTPCVVSSRLLRPHAEAPRPTASSIQDLRDPMTYRDNHVQRAKSRALCGVDHSSIGRDAFIPCGWTHDRERRRASNQRRFRRV